jgi:RHS repeat-associated protein
VAYTYDPFGNRVSRSDTGGAVDYLVDLLNPTGYVQALEEYARATGTPLTSFVYGLQPLAQTQGGARSFHHLDALGSLRLFTHGAGGGLAASFSYDAFGNLSGYAGSVPSHLRFKAEWFDAAPGLTFLRARWYQPETARFVSRDPWQGDPAAPRSLHRYQYANQNPVFYGDPSGKFTAAETVTISFVANVVLSASVDLYRCWGNTTAEGCSVESIASNAALSGLAGAATGLAGNWIVGKAAASAVSNAASAGGGALLRVLGFRGALAFIAATIDTIGYVGEEIAKSKFTTMPSPLQTSIVFMANLGLQYSLLGAPVNNAIFRVVSRYPQVLESIGPDVLEKASRGVLPELLPSGTTKRFFKEVLVEIGDEFGYAPGAGAISETFEALLEKVAGKIGEFGNGLHEWLKPQPLP